jgi:hypothetical protein
MVFGSGNHSFQVCLSAIEFLFFFWSSRFCYARPWVLSLPAMDVLLW